MTITLIILCLSAVFFVWGKVRSDLVAICAALSLVLFDILTPEEALAGFSSPTVIMMGGLFIVGGGIFSTGLAKKAGSRVLSMAGNSETKLFVLIMAATSLVGAFVSNTGTVALMLPIVVSMARAANISPSRFLMPLAFAGSMGGMLTLIGTPPNLIINEALVEAGYPSLSFFSFTPVGIICIVVGTLVLIPMTKLFLKGDASQKEKTASKTLESLAKEYQLNDELTRLKVTENSTVKGSTIKELNINEKYGVTVIEIRRTTAGHNKLMKKVTQFSVADIKLEVDDVIYVSGATDKAYTWAEEARMTVVEEKERPKKLRFYDVGMAEILIMPSSTLIGRTIAESTFRTQFGVNVLGVRRHNEYFLKDVKDVRLHASDVVLVQGPWENISHLVAEDTQWVVLGQPLEQASKVTIDYKAPLAALIMILMVAAMALDFIPIAPVTAVICAAVLMILTGCLRNVESAYKTINWESIILFGAMLPMSTALEKTGASTLISSSLVETFGGGGPYLLLAAIYLCTSLMTLFISNTVTAVLMAPIALSAAAAQSVSATPFLFAVTVAASMCFASPFSTPPNALVMSAGSYKAIDYIKVGLPLQIIMAIVMIIVLPLLFPF